MINKKVRNATKVSFDGVNFDSKLELYCYKKLKESNLSFTYNKESFELIPKYDIVEALVVRPNDTGVDTKTLKERKNAQKKVYTPDFVVRKDNYVIFVECKGRGNDTYPLVRKMFIKWIEDNYPLLPEKPVFLEPHSQKHINECIDIIKSLK